MINKQVKNYGGGVNRSTPIDLRTIDNEVAKIAGRNPRTPIDMQSLWNEVQNLKATAKSWEIVTLNKSGNTYPFNSKYAGWNFIVINGTLYNSYKDDSRGTVETTIKINRNNYSLDGHSAVDGYYLRGNYNFSISGNNIVASRNENLQNQITVLFYK